MTRAREIWAKHAGDSGGDGDSRGEVGQHLGQVGRALQMSSESGGRTLS